MAQNRSHSNKEQTDAEKDFLSRIAEALAARPVLDEKQMADIEKLKRDVTKLCRESRTDKAERVTRICLEIICQDEPAKE